MDNNDRELTEFCEETYPKVKSHMYQKFNNQADAEDALQKVYLTFWRQKHKIGDNLTKEALLWGTVKFVPAHEYRAMGRFKSRQEAWTHGETGTCSDAFGVDEMLLIETIPVKDRAVCIAHFCYGLTGAEIADALGVHSTTVYRALARGREFLVQTLAVSAKP